MIKRKVKEFREKTERKLRNEGLKQRARNAENKTKERISEKNFRKGGRVDV